MPTRVVVEVFLVGLAAAAVVLGEVNDDNVPTRANTKFKMNVLMFAVDDLRPLFGASYGTEEVLTPSIDAFFMEGGGTAVQRSYVQIAICGPSRASILTGRRPDTTQAINTQVPKEYAGWCWCQRTNCSKAALFLTIPTYFARHGYVTAGVGKIFHPAGCTYVHSTQPHGTYGADFSHVVGDDYRAWNYGLYGVEGRATTDPHYPLPLEAAQTSEEQFGSIPGPWFAVFNFSQGLSWMRSPLADEDLPDGQIATNAVERFANFSRDGVGITAGAAPGSPGSSTRSTRSSSSSSSSADDDRVAGKPFFHAVGFHKPHLPHVVPTKYFDLYTLANISLPKNRDIPSGFKEENWHWNGNMEMSSYTNNAAAFSNQTFGFRVPLDEDKARLLRLGYYAATSFIDAQVGRVLRDGLVKHGYGENTIVTLWSDHGW